VPEYAQFILRFTLFAATHSLLATDRVKQFLQRPGANESKWYRLAYNLLSMFMFGWVMAAYRHSPVLYFVPGAASLAMYLLQVIIGVLIVRCVSATGAASFLGISQLKGDMPSHVLVTDGWYALVRHPLYLLSTLFLVLNPVMTYQWAMLSALTVSYFIIGGLVEEKRLEEKFGEQYLRYRRTVPFIFPSLRFRSHRPSD